MGGYGSGRSIYRYIYYICVYLDIHLDTYIIYISKQSLKAALTSTRDLCTRWGPGLRSFITQARGGAEKQETQQQ
jgi:hypothetical protein